MSLNIGEIGVSFGELETGQCGSDFAHIFEVGPDKVSTSQSGLLYVGDGWGLAVANCVNRSESISLRVPSLTSLTTCNVPILVCRFLRLGIKLMI